jgi:hypothetical protein
LNTGAVVLDALPGNGMIAVTPAGDFAAQGPLGGPFAPASSNYVISNTGPATLNYSVSADVNWLSFTNGSGSISPFGNVTVSVATNANAAALPLGTYPGTISFVNTSSHEGDTTRNAALQVGVPTTLYAWDFETNPGWTADAEWAWGVPAGLGGENGAPDPNSGHSGTHVYGYNLDGDYANNQPERYLTTTPINCTGRVSIHLGFWRWLGVEQYAYDHAAIRVSTNGTTWTEVWHNPAEVADSAWTYQDLDIAALASNQPVVYIRWVMGTTDRSKRFCGWNIDDVAITGVIAATPGDLNCDGQVGFGDINPFVQLLVNEQSWAAAHPGCPRLNGDINGDGLVGFDDINPFVALLVQGP